MMAKKIKYLLNCVGAPTFFANGGTMMNLLNRFFLLTAAFVLVNCAESGSRNPADENREFGSCKVFFNQTGFCANLIWDQIPQDENDGGSFYLEFFEQTNPSVPVAPPVAPIVLVRPAGQEQPAVRVMVEKKNFTQYFVPRAGIVTRGPWQILIQFQSADKVVDQGTFNYNRL